jgi:deoxyribodipyrimidine photo-lyase
MTIHHPAAVRKADGKPYTVFTPFSRAWRRQPTPVFDPAPPPDDLRTPARLASASLPPAEPINYFFPGEQHAEEALRSFVSGSEAPIYDYAQGRNQLALDGTSALSPYLRFGMLSARAAYAAGQQAAAGAAHAGARVSAEAWLNELIWREFYIAILYHFPTVRRQAFRAQLRAIAWRNDAADFAAWRAGRTGYPVIDAAMRQLAVTGWMHNRARMLTASFLVKDLLIDWRWGEAWFMQHLVDGDPAANNGGWQWTAGVGTDAAPFFRVFNPTTQAAQYDPYGAFVRAWVPELHRVPDEFVHEPWRMPAAAQRDAQCLIGRDYPAPIVEHAWARQRALEAYRNARGKRALYADFADGADKGG